jgi:hypothetical protein
MLFSVITNIMNEKSNFVEAQMLIRRVYYGTGWGESLHGAIADKFPVEVLAHSA